MRLSLASLLLAPVLLMGQAGQFGVLPPSATGGPGSVTSVTLVGTANQVIVTGTCTITTSGVCTFSLPQSIATASSPTFASISTNGTGSGLYTFSGSTSGSAAIGAAAAAGTPSAMLLPISDCASGPCVMEAATASGGTQQYSTVQATGTGAPVLGTSPTIATPVIAAITNTGTETLPSTTGGIPIVIACGTTSGATANCANTNVGTTAKIYFGKATLASNASTITLSPGFTSTSTFYCEGNDVTTRANPVQVVPASATTITITDTTGATDGIQWACQGY